MHTGENDGRHDHSQPDERAAPSNEGPDDGRKHPEKALRIEQGHAPCERVHQPAHPRPLDLPFVALQDLGGIRSNVALKHVGRVELAQNLDDLVLNRGVVAEAGGGDLPDLLNGPAPVHEPDDEVGGG